jgi:hypothetical protein
MENKNCQHQQFHLPLLIVLLIQSMSQHLSWGGGGGNQPIGEFSVEAHMM